mmetsp:Transcript_12477/g.33671  ORF Transcript_12477/g.33671 Transcript_12477/m.33671 type:complete len:125 (-) Transcript_12477:74-448(-)
MVFGIRSCFYKEPTELELNTNLNARVSSPNALFTSSQARASTVSDEGTLGSATSLKNQWNDKESVSRSPSTRMHAKKFSGGVRFASKVEGAEFTSKGLQSYFKQPARGMKKADSMSVPVSAGLV